MHAPSTGTLDHIDANLAAGFALHLISLPATGRAQALYLT
jgi:hypothetical protein